MGACGTLFKLHKGGKGLELTPRKKAILAEIVKAHIQTGEPIGSKILSQRLVSSPSTATLRNEMSELTEMGYLEQPHTSAGRQPTSKAYRLYVSELMGKQDLSNEGKEIIDTMLSGVRPDVDSIGSSAAEILSNLTGLPAISASGTGMGVKIKKVSLLPMGRGAAVVFVITDDGRTRSRLVRTSGPFTPELALRFENIAASKICGKEASQLDKAYLQAIAISAGFDALSLAPLFSCVFEMAKELRAARVDTFGEANLFSLCPSDADAKRMLEILHTGDAVHSILSKVNTPVGVVFGDDTDYFELAPTGMVVASYGDNKLGRIAVIGPTRMAYESIMPCAEYLAARVGALMNEVLKGLEE